MNGYLRTYLLLCVVCNAGLCLGQDQSGIDSLKKVSAEAKEDTSKIRALNKLCWLLGYSKPDESLEYGNQALKLAREIDYKTGIAVSLNNIGVTYAYQANYTKTKVYFQQALEIYELKGNVKRVAALYNNIGEIYRMQGNYPKALENQFLSLKIKEEIGDSAGITFAYNNIGVVYKNQDELEKALEYFNRAMDLCERVEGGQSKGSLYLNIGLIHKANAFSERGHQDFGYAQKEYAKAVEHYYKALSIYEAEGNKKRISSAYVNIGIIYTEWAGWIEDQKEIDSLLVRAFEIQMRCLKIQEELGDRLVMTYSYKLIGIIKTLQENYEEAIVALNTSIELASEIGAVKELSYGYKHLAEAYEAKGDYELSLKYFKDYTALTDSLFNESKSKEIGKLEARYEFDKQEAEEARVREIEIARIGEEKSRSNNLQYSAILIVLVLMVAGVLALGKFSVSILFAEGMVFFTFLLFFEFLLVLLDPYIENYSGGAPAYKLLFNAVLAGMIFPLHSFFESAIKIQLNR